MTILEKFNPTDSDSLQQVIATNLKKLRVRNGLSLERLAAISGVSKSMLGQIELGKSAPTINLLWKVALALGVPFSALYANAETQEVVVLPASKAKVLYSKDGSFSSRALFPFNEEGRKVEFYELELKPGAEEIAEAHALDTVENLVVASGEIEVTVQNQRYKLGSKDSINFKADVPHSYRNTSLQNKAVIYLVMIYSDKVNY